MMRCVIRQELSEGGTPLHIFRAVSSELSMQIACRGLPRIPAVDRPALVYSSAERRGEVTIVSATVRPRQSRACQEARPRARRNEAKNGLPMDRIDPPEERNRDDSREESVDSSSNSARSSSADSNSVTPGPANGVPNGISRARSETTRSGQDARGKKSAVDGSTTVGTARPGPVCRVCPLRSSCRSICEVIEAILPSPERGRTRPI